MQAHKIIDVLYACFWEPVETYHSKVMATIWTLVVCGRNSVVTGTALSQVPHCYSASCETSYPNTPSFVFHALVFMCAAGVAETVHNALWHVIGIVATLILYPPGSTSMS